MLQINNAEALLTLVPTPIGNLEDITFRAIRLLNEADLILCEDTRVTSRLLQKYDINKPTKSYHQHNEHNTVEYIIGLLKQQKKICLVSDAGTPGLSDPGYLLIKACQTENIAYQTLPGPNALLPAFVNSGFDNHHFFYAGFLPQKKGRNKQLSTLKKIDGTIVLYESPYRIVKLLEEINIIFGEETQVSISREISKLHEETLLGTPSELIGHFAQNQPKGEFVVAISNRIDLHKKNENFDNTIELLDE